MILCRFSGGFRQTTLESHNSKRMTVYEQIIFFIEKLNFPISVFDRKIYVWIEKTRIGTRRNWNQKEPEPDRAGNHGNPGITHGL